MKDNTPNNVSCKGCNSPEHGQVPWHVADVTDEVYLVFWVVIGGLMIAAGILLIGSLL